MAKLNVYVKSMRLRTLPLSLSGILMGSLLALADYRVPFVVILLVCLTTVLLQILANLCNELGDVQHGTDNAYRVGPAYALNSGEVTIKQMKGCIFLFVALCIISGIIMIKVSFGSLFKLESICLLLLGAAAIIAAMRYTMGRNPYGYRGLGDIYVYVFFGLVTVLGSYFICAHTLHSWLLLLPATTIGLFSVGVLNTNNIRDIKTDAPNRVTVAIRLGVHKARIYETILIVLGWACMIAYTFLRTPDIRHWLYVLTLPLFAMHLRGVWTHEEGALDKYLPMLVMASFLFSILAGIGFTAFLW